MNKKTKKGVNYMMYGLLAHAVSGLLGAITLEATIQAAIEEDFANIPTGASCFGALVGLAALVFYLIGLYNLWSGTSRVKEKHRKKVLFGIVLLIIGFIAGEILSRGISGLTIDAAEDVRSAAVTAAVAGTITSAIFGFALIMLVYEISSKKNRRLLYGAFIFLIVINIIYVWRASTVPTTGELEEVAQVFISRSVQYWVLEFFAFVAFAAAYFLIPTDFVVKGTNSKKVESAPLDGDERTYKLYPCPKCDEEQMDVDLDGSGFCKACGKTTKNYNDEFEEDEKET